VEPAEPAEPAEPDEVGVMKLSIFNYFLFKRGNFVCLCVFVFFFSPDFLVLLFVPGFGVNWAIYDL